MKNIIRIIFAFLILVSYSCKKEHEPLPLPTPPSDLIATAISGSEIRLDWTDNSDNEEGFVLVRRGDGYYTEINIAANLTTYLDTGLTSKDPYTYEIYAYNADNQTGESAYSGNVWIFRVPDILPDWPSYISSNAIGSVLYTQDDGGQPILEHGVIWDINDNPDTTMVTKSKQGLIDEKEYSLYDITGLLPNTKYYIRGYAVNSVGIGYSYTYSITTTSE